VTLGCVAATEMQSESAAWGLLRPLCGVPCPLFDHISRRSDHHQKGAFPWNLPVGPSGGRSEAPSTWGLSLHPPHGPPQPAASSGAGGVLPVWTSRRGFCGLPCVSVGQTAGRGSRGAGGRPGGAHEGQADAREGLTRGRWGSRGADRRPGGAHEGQAVAREGLTRGRRKPGRGHEGQADAREGLTRAVCFLGPAELSPQVTVCALRHLPSRVSESSLDPTSGWSCVISVPPRRHHKSSVIGPVLILHTRRLRRGRPRDACRPRAASSQLHLRCPGSGEASVK